MSQPAYDFSRIKTNLYKALHIDPHAPLKEIETKVDGILKNMTLNDFEEKVIHVTNHHVNSRINYDRVGDALFASTIFHDEKMRAAYDQYLLEKEKEKEKEKEREEEKQKKELLASMSANVQTATEKPIKKKDPHRTYTRYPREEKEEIVSRYSTVAPPVASAHKLSHPDIKD